MSDETKPDDDYCGHVEEPDDSRQTSEEAMPKWDKFSGYGVAIRGEYDPPIPGEPFMSMAVARRIAAEMVKEALAAACEVGVHMEHCFTGRTYGCKYGEPDCPARPSLTERLVTQEMINAAVDAAKSNGLNGPRWICEELIALILNAALLKQQNEGNRNV